MTGPGTVLLAALGVTGLGLWGYALWRLGVAERESLVDRTAHAQLDGGRRRPFEGVDRRLRRTDLGRWTAGRLQRAGLSWRVVDALGALALVVLVSYEVSVQFVSWWIALLVATGLGRAALGWLDRRERARLEAFVAQLPEIARVLSNATGAGLALRSAIRLAADDMAEPAKGELQRLTDELDIGTSMSDALASLERRLPSRELSLLTRTLIIQARAGGAVVTALREMSETLEARKDLRREIRTLLAGSVFTSWVVLILGVGSVLTTNLIAPGTLHRLTTTLLGQVVLAVSATLYAIGFGLIRRTTRIEV